MVDYCDQEDKSWSSSQPRMCTGSEIFCFLDWTRFQNLNQKGILSLIRSKGKPSNGCFKKIKHAKVLYVCVSGGKK